jgi:hypothetical protein
MDINFLEFYSNGRHTDQPRIMPKHTQKYIQDAQFSTKEGPIWTGILGLRGSCCCSRCVLLFHSVCGPEGPRTWRRTPSFSPRPTAQIAGGARPPLLLGCLCPTRNPPLYSSNLSLPSRPFPFFFSFFFLFYLAY